MRYIQRAKYFILIYSNCDELKINEFADSDFTRGPDDMKSTSTLCLNWLVERYHKNVWNRPQSTMQVELTAYYEIKIQAYDWWILFLGWTIWFYFQAH